MSGEHPTGAGKIAVVCPHCGSKQSESVFAQSTICRKCSAHYPIGKGAAPQALAAAAEKNAPSFLAKFKKLIHREQVRSIRCLDCGAPQQVSSFAESSICPQCSSFIELKDFKIGSSYSRNIHTQGCVTIMPKGDVSSTKIACGEAAIYGKMNGNLICTGKVKVKLKGRLSGGLDAQQLVIEKGSNIEFVRAIKGHRVEIFGKVSARVMSDIVMIGKTGSLEGTVYAKSISVEKGGVFHGELYIGKQELEQTELLTVPKGKKQKPRAEPDGEEPSLALV